MERPSRDELDRRQQVNIAVLIVVVALVANSVVVMLELKSGLSTEDCIAAGHRNCVPIEVPEPH
jgi:hypothetical protein